jgi:septal ring factor EnvC (AmiA/AmiB activator)
MKAIINVLVALVIGAGGMFLYQQGAMKELRTTAAALETRLSESKAKIDASAAEVTKLQDAGKTLETQLAEAKTQAEGAAAELTKSLEAKAQEATVLQAKISELEAALTAAKASSGTAQ